MQPKFLIVLNGFISFKIRALCWCSVCYLRERTAEAMAKYMSMKHHFWNMPIWQSMAQINVQGAEMRCSAAALLLPEGSPNPPGPKRLECPTKMTCSAISAINQEDPCPTNKIPTSTSY